MLNISTLTERDLDLIEVALEACAQACQAGANLTSLSRGAPLDPLAAEYLTALKKVTDART